MHHFVVKFSKFSNQNATDVPVGGVTRVIGAQGRSSEVRPPPCWGRAWVQKQNEVKYTDIAVHRLTCHTATGTHMPYGITQCYLPPDTGDIPAFTPAEAGTLLSYRGGCKAELT